MRAAPGDRQEQVSQLLFGEHFTILEKQSTWIKIRIAHDSYIGFIDSKQYKSISESEFLDLETVDPYISFELYTELIPYSVVSKCPEDFVSNHFSDFKILNGSILPSFKNGFCSIANELFTVKGDITRFSPFSEKLLERFMLLYANAPYQWGGRSIYGIDCSGLTQLFSRFAGVKIPRDAADQALTGRSVPSLNDALAGDLAFFVNDVGKIIHVGILTGRETIFHASGQVRIDKIDDLGIYNTGSKTYTHTFHSLMRIF